MRRLYLRIYLAVLASLAAFALVSGFLWRQLGDVGPAGTLSKRRHPRPERPALGPSAVPEQQPR